MSDNPYGKLINIMRSEGAYNNPSSLLIAEVVQSSPVAIKVGDTIVDKDNIMIADYLQTEYNRKVKIANASATGNTQSISGGSGDSSFSAHSHNVTNVGIASTTVTTLDTLKVGDNVAVMPINGNQLFIILCRVVRA